MESRIGVLTGGRNKCSDVNVRKHRQIDYSSCDRSTLHRLSDHCFVYASARKMPASEGLTVRAKMNEQRTTEFRNALVRGRAAS
jgi:hypothetical protein